MSPVVAAQVATSGVSGREHGAAEVPGQDAEQQLSQVFALLEHVSAEETPAGRRLSKHRSSAWGRCEMFAVPLSSLNMHVRSLKVSCRRRLTLAEKKSVKCCFELRLDELNDPRRGGGGICDDGLSVSRQSDRCGGPAQGACGGESAAAQSSLTRSPSPGLASGVTEQLCAAFPLSPFIV